MHCRRAERPLERYICDYMFNMFHTNKTNKRLAGAKTATPVVNADTAQTTIPILCAYKFIYTIHIYIYIYGR